MGVRRGHRGGREDREEIRLRVRVIEGQGIGTRFLVLGPSVAENLGLIASMCCLLIGGPNDRIK